MLVGNRAKKEKSLSYNGRALTLTGMNWAMSLSYEALSLALIRDSAFLQLSMVPRIVMVLSMLYAVRSFSLCVCVRERERE